LGQDIIIHRDHKNLLYEKSASERIIRWRPLIEEYAPTFLHIKGEHNVVADALSRLNTNYTLNVNNQPSAYEQARANTYICI
jgi:hypothetical protein